MDRSAPALSIGRSEDDGAPIVITEGELLEGIAVGGPPGGGKRSVLLALLARQVARGGGAVFLEGRPSRRALGAFLAAAEQADRLDVVRLYEPSTPSRSHRYNPLAGKGLAPLASLLLHLGAPPARRAGSAVDGATRRGAEALVAGLLDEGGPLTLAAVRRRLAESEPSDRRRLARAQAGLPVVGPATWRRRLAQELDRLLMNDGAAPLMAESNEIDLGAVVEGGGLLYVGLGVVADEALAASLAALVLADLRVAIESRPAPAMPLLLLLDTAEAYLVPPLLGLLEASPRTALAPVVSLADAGLQGGSPLAAQVLARMPARLAHRITLAAASEGRRPGSGVVELAGRPPRRAALALEDAPAQPERTEALRTRLLAR
ncbi:MAG TPA: hypothetical protein VF406_12180 [Thermodesulfobacteriota bacterium]